MDELIYTNIAKELNGETTAEEHEQLKKWLNADPKNMAIYEDIRTSWDKLDTLLETPTFNTSAAWEKISGKVISSNDVIEERKGKTIIFKQWMRYSMAAAAVLILGMFILKRGFNSDTITIVATDKNEEVTLSDNSRITVRQGSTLTYPKTFASDERTVELEGEAFFEITRDEQKPFIIDAQSASVKVLGTSFNVTCDQKKAVVVVRTGKVQMSANKTKTAVILTAGEKGALEGGNLTEEQVLPDNYFSWKTGILNFTAQPLADVVKQISDLKNVPIQLDNSISGAHSQQMINITFHDQSVEDMLTELCLIAQCQWSKQGDAYIIKAK